MTAIKSSARQELGDALLRLTEGDYENFEGIWRQLSKEVQNYPAPAAR